jgi:hypothetical protein
MQELRTEKTVGKKSGNQDFPLKTAGTVFIQSVFLVVAQGSLQKNSPANP